jgi:Beta protein
MTVRMYTPIVKAKLNDLKAVQRLSDDVLAIAKPMIEVLPPPKGASNVDEVLRKLCEQAEKYLGGMEIFLDFYWFGNTSLDSLGENGAIAGFRQLAKKGIFVTPTYAVDRDPSLWKKLGAVIKLHNRGFCFRVDIDDLDDQAPATWNEIKKRAMEIGVSLESMDLLIDMRDVRAIEQEGAINTLLDFLGSEPEMEALRSIIIVGSSALKDVTSVPKNDVLAVPRRELSIWSRLIFERPGLKLLSFGDYGVIHPDFSPRGPSKHMNGKIRYTTGTDTRYCRGNSLREGAKFAQYFSLAKQVTSEVSYCGPAYSFGDKYVHDCANSNVGPGNLGSWVLADMNHHMTYVSRQIQALSNSIANLTTLAELEDVLESL